MKKLVTFLMLLLAALAVAGTVYVNVNDLPLIIVGVWTCLYDLICGAAILLFIVWLLLPNQKQRHTSH